MPAASRIQLVPPEAWDERRLVEAATRALSPTGQPLRPGDALGELVVLTVEPEPGATLSSATEVEVIPAPRSAEGAQVDVAILLDASESMGTPWSGRHTRLDAAHESVAAFLRAPAPAVASVSVIEYAKQARLVAGPAPPGELTLRKPSAPAGRCATAAALDAALAHLAGRSASGRAQVVFLLTDGVSEVPEVRQAAVRASRLRIPVHALVFAPELDEVLQELSETTGGTAQVATLPLTIEFVHQPGA